MLIVPVSAVSTADIVSMCERHKETEIDECMNGVSMNMFSRPMCVVQFCIKCALLTLL